MLQAMIPYPKEYHRQMPVDLVQLKIERAGMHIDEMERCLSVCFHDAITYQLATKDDRGKRESVLCVTKAHELPPPLTGLNWPNHLRG